MVVGVTNENDKLVAKSVESNRMQFPIAIVHPEEEFAWGIKAFPTSYLVDVDGTILWKGLPGKFDDEVGDRLEGWLKQTTLLPALPDEHEAIAKLLAKDDWGGAYAKATKALERNAEDEALKGLVAWLTERTEKDMAAAVALEEQGAFGRAQVLYQQIVERCEGIPGGEEAAGRLAALGKNKEAKDDLDAGKKLRSAIETWRKGDLEKALKSFASIAKKHPDTDSGARAAEIVGRHGD